MENYDEEKFGSDETSFDETTMPPTTTTTKNKKEKNDKAERRRRNLSKLSDFFKTFEHHESLSMLCIDEVMQERVIKIG